MSVARVRGDFQIAIVSFRQGLRGLKNLTWQEIQHLARSSISKIPSIQNQPKPYAVIGCSLLAGMTFYGVATRSRQIALIICAVAGAAVAGVLAHKGFDPSMKWMQSLMR